MVKRANAACCRGFDWMKRHAGFVQYLLVECRNSIPPQRHSQQSEYLCNRKGSTDTENRERDRETQEESTGEGVRDNEGRNALVECERWSWWGWRQMWEWVKDRKDFFLNHDRQDRMGGSQRGKFGKESKKRIKWISLIHWSKIWWQQIKREIVWSKKEWANKIDQTGKKHICNQKTKGVIEFTLSRSFHKMSGNK